MVVHPPINTEINICKLKINCEYEWQTLDSTFKPSLLIDVHISCTTDTSLDYVVTVGVISTPSWMKWRRLLNIWVSLPPDLSR